MRREAKHEAVKKILAFAVCVLFIVVTLLSVTFVITHTHHEHDRDGPSENCSICIRLAVAGNILKLLAAAFACKAFGSGGFSVARSAIKAACFHAASLALVHQKIKLNI